MVTLLLKLGVDPNVTDKWGQTPLHYLVYMVDKNNKEAALEVATLLLEYGANPTAQDNFEVTVIVHLTKRHNLIDQEVMLLMLTKLFEYENLPRKRDEDIYWPSAPGATNSSSLCHP